MGNENLRPWERQDGETEKAFSAFKAYLEMELRLLKGCQKVDNYLSIGSKNIIGKNVV
jgi:hypothetical protein